MTPSEVFKLCKAIAEFEAAENRAIADGHYENGNRDLGNMREACVATAQHIANKIDIEERKNISAK